MKNNGRWTIRGISEDARLAVTEVHEFTGIPHGRLISDAILLWYSELDEADPAPPVRPPV